MQIENLAELWLATFAAGLAGIFVAAALVERPPSARHPRGLVALLGLWAIAFAAGAVGVLANAGLLAVAGLLFAASELAVAAAIWTSRSIRQPPDDDGGGGSDPDDAPTGPPGVEVPAEYWERWADSLRDHEYRLN